MVVPMGLAAAVGAMGAYMLSKKRLCTPRDAIEEIKSHWASVRKTAGGRVDRAAFKEHCMSMHRSKLTAASQKSFEEFLDKTFDAAVSLMLKPGAPLKADLGRHCFSCTFTQAPRVQPPIAKIRPHCPQMRFFSWESSTSTRQQEIRQRRAAAAPVWPMLWSSQSDVPCHVALSSLGAAGHTYECSYAARILHSVII